MRHLSLASLIAALSLVSMGCADDGASLFITQISILDDECLVDESTLQLAPLVDISLSENLIVYPLFASQLRDRVSPNAANPSDMHVRRVDVRLEDLGGNTLNLGLPNPFRVPTNAFIESFTGTGQFNTASGSVEVLPPGYAAAIAAQGGSAVAALRPIGLTSGGIEVEGNFDFHVQIDVCTGCLLRCVVGDEEPTMACRPGQNQLTITDDPTLCGP